MSLAFPRDRSYAAAPSTHNVALQYGWSPNFVQTGGANSVTGNFIPLQLDGSGFLQAVIANATFSGQLEVNTDTMEGLLSGISGELAVVTKSDNPSGYFPYTGFVHVNRAVVTSGYNPVFGSGQAAVPAIDNINGGVLSVLSDLDQSVDSVTTYPATATTVSNYVPSGNNNLSITTGNILLANPNRIAWGIQNVGSGSSLFLKLGSAPASTGSFTWLLKAASTDYAADGGTFLDSPAMYRGDVSISGSSRFTVWEM